MKKSKAVPYEVIEEVNKLGKDGLVKRFVQEENDILALKKVASKDATLSDLKKQIQERKKATKEEADKLKEQIKALYEDDEMEQLMEDKTALEKGYRDEAKRRKALRDYLYERVSKVFV